MDYKSPLFVFGVSFSAVKTLDFPGKSHNANAQKTPFDL